MKPRFAWSVPIDNPRVLGDMRRWPGIEAIEVPPRIWLRAAHSSTEQEDFLRRVPDIDRYSVLDDGQLIPVSGRVPSDHLPSGAWRPLAELLSVELPSCDDSLVTPCASSLRLVRSVIEREPTWLHTSLATWTAYAATAPQVRLARWTFAADRRGQVVVRGAPLPPLPGTRLVDHDGIIVPAGWTWQPHVSADVVREAFALQARDALLWMPDASCQRIRSEDLVQATRSAARSTAVAVTS